jgi:hypothetical protein
MTMIPASRYNLVALRYHARLHATGMRHSQITPTQLRLKIEQVTSRKFKRGDWDAMCAALTDIISTLDAELCPNAD